MYRCNGLSIIEGISHTLNVKAAQLGITAATKNRFCQKLGHYKEQEQDPRKYCRKNYYLC